MIVGPVDHCHAHIFARELFCSFQASETGTHNHDMRLLRRRIFHATVLQQHCRMKAPNSKFQIPGKLQSSMSKERKVARFSFSNLRIEISLELGRWGLELCRRRLAGKRTLTGKQKQFVIAAAATIFRALCRSLSLAAKLENQSRNDLK